MKFRGLAAAGCAVALAVTGVSGASAAPGGTDQTPPKVRFATYNVAFDKSTSAGELIDVLQAGSADARSIAEVIQINRPDVLLVNEIDWDAAGEAADIFQEDYLEVGQNNQKPITYPYRYLDTVNTGVLSGSDLNHDGTIALPDDGHGFGLFEGQYGMLVLSMYPIDTAAVRTFQNFLWTDMPGNLLPYDWFDNPPVGPPASPTLRLSSKSHWDLPILIGDETVHLLASHPTPPAFDDNQADRNKRHNYDEIRFWSDYMKSGSDAAYIYDDNGVHGGLPQGAKFVMVGDQNTDPNDGDGLPGAIAQVLDLPMVTDPLPSSRGGVVNDRSPEHITDPKYDTSFFSSFNLRVDYVLPGNLKVGNSKVYWPAAGPGADLVTASDHRLVWADVFPGQKVNK
jgi:hypothetical protein